MYQRVDQYQQIAVSEALNWSVKNSEQNLVDWWMNQAESSTALRCVDGTQVVVLSRGEINDGPGPDLLNCRIILDDLELTGAIEVHQKSSDWYAHGHEGDPAYESVILHLVGTHDRGPDIPTLQQPMHAGIPFSCLASRAVTQTEINIMASRRMISKERHVRTLAENARGLDPLLLGMVEVMLAGPMRNGLLEEIALFLGLPCWPDMKPWQGSRRSYKKVDTGIRRIVGRLVTEGKDLYQSLDMNQMVTQWVQFETLYRKFHAMGVSKNQVREWVVNVWAPSLGIEEGLRLWQALPPFRAYGYEKRILVRVGRSNVDSILVQQALLEWRNIYCKPRICDLCPLLHSHHGLGPVN